MIKIMHGLMLITTMKLLVQPQFQRKFGQSLLDKLRMGGMKG